MRELTFAEFEAIEDVTAPESLARLLESAGVEVPLDVVERWDEATRGACADWACAVYLEEPPHPPRPAILELFA